MNVSQSLVEDSPVCRVNDPQKGEEGGVFDPCVGLVGLGLGIFISKIF